MSTLYKMGSFDIIRVHVHDDGDIELQKHHLDDLGRIPEYLKMTYPNDLFFDLAEIVKGHLDSELVSYGCDADRVKEAIDEVITSNYINTTKV